MTEEKYTAEQLEQMADQLLQENAPAQEKPAKGGLDEKTIASLPAAALLNGNEKLRDLFTKGKKKGKLDAGELSDVLDELDLESEQMDSIYDSLEQLGIEVGSEDFLADLPDEDGEPAMDEIAEIEEEELVDPNTLVDSFNIDDPVRMYLKEIGKVPLLTADQEVELATAMSAGREAKERLAELEESGETLPEDEMAALKKRLKAGERAKQQLAEANLRLVVSIAKRYVIHTALDTSGGPFCMEPDYLESFQKLMDVTDLFILDMKEMDPERHKALTGQDNRNILAFARYLSAHKKPMWIRHVLVPGLTDSRESLETLYDFIRELKSVERVEILPYHTMGVHKWEALGIPYSLKNVLPPTEEEVRRAEEILSLIHI